MKISRTYTLDRGHAVVTLSAESVHELFGHLHHYHGLSAETAGHLAAHAWRQGRAYRGAVTLSEVLPSREHFDARWHEFWEGF